MGTSSLVSKALSFKPSGVSVLGVRLGFRLWEPQRQKVATATLISPAVLLHMPTADPGFVLVGILTRWLLAALSSETRVWFEPGS